MSAIRRRRRTQFSPGGDLGSAAASWLAVHGAAYGLSRVHANEPWHFELRSEAPSQGCPPPYSDPTQDPRLHP